MKDYIFKTESGNFYLLTCSPETKKEIEKTCDVNVFNLKEVTA